ncbi:unnamed protein product [Strongylus vulgaris]|uniref:Alcohol dehydrogenase-like C-terminal domain-containing protein n=1 Tax=Strongylus vulgaris TaxID=40348 RepID=A0A3P7JQU8_STRVU|nr:unnamed protein product [Strongylus vulgaris]
MIEVAVTRLPDNATFEDASLLETLSVVFHACRRGNVQMGQRILVLGEGTIGILCMMTVKAMGAAQVANTDLDSAQLVAKKLGADHTTCVKNLLVNKVRETVIDCLTEPDVTIECTREQSCVEAAIFCIDHDKTYRKNIVPTFQTTVSGEVVVLVGLGKQKVRVSLTEACIREVDIRGVFRYANWYVVTITSRNYCINFRFCYSNALNLIASEKLYLSTLTQAHYE